MKAQKFQKNQRLTSKKEIEILFANGKTINLKPLKLIYTSKTEKTKTQVLFSVPSRTFKNATDRNLLKRRMRESFRINRQKLEVPVNLNLAYIYIAHHIVRFEEIEKKMVQSFQLLRNEFVA